MTPSGDNNTPHSEKVHEVGERVMVLGPSQYANNLARVRVVNNAANARAYSAYIVELLDDGTRLAVWGDEIRAAE